MKTCSVYLEEFDATLYVQTNFEPLENIADIEFSFTGGQEMPILNEKFIDLLEVNGFVTFKALMKSFAAETALPEQLQVDEKFMKKLSKSGTKKRILPTECPDVYSIKTAAVLNKGMLKNYFSLFLLTKPMNEN